MSVYRAGRRSPSAFKVADPENLEIFGKHTSSYQAGAELEDIQSEDEDEVEERFRNKYESSLISVSRCFPEIPNSLSKRSMNSMKGSPSPQDWRAA